MTPSVLIVARDVQFDKTGAERGKDGIERGWRLEETFDLLTFDLRLFSSCVKVTE